MELAHALKDSICCQPMIHQYLAQLVHAALVILVILLANHVLDHQILVNDKKNNI